MGRIILTPGGPRHPLEARAPAVRNEATVIILLAVHSSIYWRVTVSDPLGLLIIFMSSTQNPESGILPTAEAVVQR